MRDRCDSIDLKILEILQQEGRIKRGDLAEKVSLSISSVSDRLRKLEERAIIRSYHASLDPGMVGLNVTAFILISTDTSRHYRSIVDKASELDEIVECHAITGEGSHLLKARTQSTASLERLLSTIQSWKGVINTRTSIVLSSPKEDSAVPLKYFKSQIEK